MSEQGFHEIQLNGKQLVFLFMAATVVSVVIFLCGVMVGRGVRPAVAAGPESATALAADPDVESATSGLEIPGAHEVSPTSPAQSPEQAPPVVQDDEHYDFDARLTEQETADRLEPAQPPAARSLPASPPPARPEPAAEKTAAAASPAPGNPLPGTYAVQLVALRERADADALAKRLTGKGYAAYVVMPAAGSPPVYRVQVGKYKTRGEAEKVAARLRTEERFKPWVTR